MARYICFEGSEGVGKTTQTQKLVDYLKTAGHKVLQTKEPGTPLSALTMTLRGVMLDNKYDAEMTPIAREYISQAIRSIHLENVIKPAYHEYDFIVQDRGVLSGLAYGNACGHSFEYLQRLAQDVSGGEAFSLYSDVLYLKGDVTKGLDLAKASKQEFESGDAMESQGNAFYAKVSQNMDEWYKLFSGGKMIAVDGKDIEQVFDEIKLALSV
jgi:dTMP kinase